MQLNIRPHGFWLMAAALLYVPQALAYLDPATGSMIIQGIIGAIAGAAVACRLYWHRFKAWLNTLSGKHAVPAAKTDDVLSRGSSPSERE